MVPAISIEPKWYYNIKKRYEIGKDAENNSGNFLSFPIYYTTDWVFVSTSDGKDASQWLSIIPTWGFRRNLGKRFNYELGAGLGYGYYFEDYTVGYNGELAYNLHIRIGYIFLKNINTFFSILVQVISV